MLILPGYRAGVTVGAGASGDPVAVPAVVRVGPGYPGCPITVDEAIAAGRSLRAPRWGLWDVVIMLVGAFIVSALALVVLALIDPPREVTLIVGSIAPWIFLGGYPVLITWLRGNGPVIDLGLVFRRRDVGIGVVVGLVGLVVAALLAWLTSLVAGTFTSAGGEVAKEISAGGSRPAMLAFAIVVALGAPVVEELAFRGLLFDALRKRGLGAVWTIVITTLAFAAIHLEPTRIVVLIGIGALLGVLRWRTGALGAGIVTHAMINAPAAVVFALAGPGGVTP